MSARSSTTRRVATRRRTGSKWRRGTALLGALAIGVAGALVVTELDVGETIREVTLPLRHEDIIRQQAAEKDVDPALIAAVIFTESRFQDQTSHAGARGLMQITPETANAIEQESGGTTFVVEDLSDPDINISYGTFHLDYLLDQYGSNEVAALAAYNAGETEVNSWGGADVDADDIEFAETHSYVEQVLDKRDEYRDHYADELGL